MLRPGGITIEQLESVVVQSPLAAAAAVENNNTKGDAVATGLLRTRKVLVHKRDYNDDGLEMAPTTPGMKYRHYAPSAPVILLVDPTRKSSTTTSSATTTQIPIETIHSFLSSLSSSHKSRIILGLLLTEDSPYLAPLTSALSSSAFHGCYEYKVRSLGTIDRPQVIAQRLFDGFLTLDNDGVDVIIVESIPETHEGLAIMNRVRKAAGEIRNVTIGRTSKI